jgi:hypothetical protein
MKFNSAKSIGFGILLWGVMIVLIVSVVIIPGSFRLPAAVVSLIVSGFLLWIWFGTYYVFMNTSLAIRFGPFYENVPYEKIFSIRPVKSMASSMALSSEMIELRHGKNYITGTTYISPVDRDVFMSELRNRCPNLAPGIVVNPR